MYYLCFNVLQVIVRVIVDYFNKSEKNHALLNRVQSATSDAEKIELTRISKSMQIHATILPIRSVGVQGTYKKFLSTWLQFVFTVICLGDARTYSYVVGLSSEKSPDWNDLIFLAKLIPRILHNVNRVCYVFGGPVVHQITDITHTRVSQYALAQIRQADHLATQVRVLRETKIWILLIFIFPNSHYCSSIVIKIYRKCRSY